MQPATQGECLSLASLWGSRRPASHMSLGQAACAGQSEVPDPSASSHAAGVTEQCLIACSLPAQAICQARLLPCCWCWSPASRRMQIAQTVHQSWPRPMLQVLQNNV